MKETSIECLTNGHYVCTNKRTLSLDQHERSQLRRRRRLRRLQLLRRGGGGRGLPGWRRRRRGPRDAPGRGRLLRGAKVSLVLLKTFDGTFLGSFFHIQFVIYSKRKKTTNNGSFSPKSRKKLFLRNVFKIRRCSFFLYRAGLFLDMKVMYPPFFSRLMPEEADNVEFVEDGEDPRNNLDLWTRGNREKMTKKPEKNYHTFFP